MIDYNLTPGDEISFTSISGIKMQATFIAYNELFGYLIAFKDSQELTPACNAGNYLVKEIEKLGLDYRKPIFRTLHEDEKDIKIIKKMIDFKKLKVGDRVEVSIDGRNTYTATIISPYVNDISDIYFSFDTHQNFGWDKNSSFFKDLKEKCPNILNVADENGRFRYATEADHIVEIITQSNHKEENTMIIENKDLKNGDIILININNDKDFTATIVGKYSNKFVIQLDKVYKTSSGKILSLDKGDYDRASAVFDPDIKLSTDQVYYEIMSTVKVKKILGNVKQSTFVQTFKSDATKAGYRVAATQMTSAVKAAIVKLLTDKGTEAGKVQAIAEMLDTEMGHALVSTLLGHGLNHTPKLKDDPRLQTLAKEFRVNGMAVAGNVLADGLMQYVLPSIMETVSSLPPVEKVRVATDNIIPQVEDTEQVTNSLTSSAV